LSELQDKQNANPSVQLPPFLMQLLDAYNEFMHNPTNEDN